MAGDLAPVLDPDFSGAVLVRAVGRRTIVVRGWADLEAHVAITPSTRFNVASLTKLITATAVCRLVQHGALGFRQSLAELLPGSGIPAATKIRVEHLLTHTAGFPEEALDTGEDDIVGDHWLAAARTGLLFEPGTDWAYSNIGYGVLGAVIERTTGRSFADMVQELVLGPSRMTETDVRGLQPTQSAIGYEPSGGYRDGDEPTGGWRPIASIGRPKPYGYAWSTVGDLERLIDAIAADGLVTQQYRDRIVHGRVATGQPRRWAGFGMFQEEVGGHSIATLSGAGPGISAWLDVRDERGADYLAVVLSNRPKPAAHAVGDQLRRHHLSTPSLSGPARSRPDARSEEAAPS
jgi:CubicO group peptidase (beta-lactamase class C family)